MKKFCLVDTVPLALHLGKLNTSKRFTKSKGNFTQIAGNDDVNIGFWLSHINSPYGYPISIIVDALMYPSSTCTL